MKLVDWRKSARKSKRPSKEILWNIASGNSKTPKITSNPPNDGGLFLKKIPVVFQRDFVLLLNNTIAPEVRTRTPPKIELEESGS